MKINHLMNRVARLLRRPELPSVVDVRRGRMRIDSQQLMSRFTKRMHQPDPPDLRGVVAPDVRRGSRLLYSGRPNRRSTVGIPLLIRWYQHRIMMKEEA